MRTVTVKYTCDLCKVVVDEKTSDFLATKTSYVHEFRDSHTMRLIDYRGPGNFIEVCHECYAPFSKLLDETLKKLHDT